MREIFTSLFNTLEGWGNIFVNWLQNIFGYEISILEEHNAFSRLFIALICGALIGLERTHADKPAGLRTNIFICTGSALFTLASILSWQVIAGSSPAVDPSRIAAQIVTGVSFIGAAAVLRVGDSVTGITTAATTWISAAIGLVIGLGFTLLGLVVSLFVTAILMVLGRVERRFLHKK